MPIVVRPAGTGELAVVGRLTLDAYTADGYIVEDDFYAAHLLDAAARAEGGELLVAELDGEVVGTVTFCPQGSTFSEVAGPDEGEFRMLAVAPSARRRGAAESLVVACVDRSRELGYTALVLSSLPEQVAAHRLYRRLGFRRTPEKDWSPAPGVELIGFRREL